MRERLRDAKLNARTMPLAAFAFLAVATLANLLRAADSVAALPLSVVAGVAYVAWTVWPSKDERVRRFTYEASAVSFALLFAAVFAYSAVPGARPIDPVVALAGVAAAAVLGALIVYLRSWR